MPWIHNPHHDITDDWRQSVSRWLREDGEVLFVLRYAFGGGAKDYCLIRDAATLWQLVDVVPKGTDVIAIRGSWLPLRGAIDEGFIAKALQLVKNETEYMFVIDMAKAVDDPRMNGGFDIGHGMMRDDLNQHIGQLAAFGECPNFMANDSEAMKSFSKDGWDGPR
jgi:hypothetical protein